MHNERDKDCGCEACWNRRIRRNLAKDLGRSTVPARVWEYLEETGHIAEVREDPATHLDLANKAELLLGYAEQTDWPGLTRPSGPRHEEQPTVDPAPALLSADEKARASAVGVALVGLAAASPEVQRFRTTVLGGELLSRDQADAFVNSPVLETLGRDALTDAGVPLVGHSVRSFTSEAVRFRDVGEYCERVAIVVDPPGTLIETFFPKTAAAAKRQGMRAALPVPYSRMHGPRPWVWRGSVLDDLRTLGERLARRYGWQDADAVWFLLTGEAPPVPAIQTRHTASDWGDFERATVTLTVEAWVSGESVKKAYEARRNQVASRPRRPGAKMLAVYRFVESQRTAGDRLPTWRELVKTWDKLKDKPPGWSSYGGNWRNLSRDYNNRDRGAARALLAPYGWDREDERKNGLR